MIGADWTYLGLRRWWVQAKRRGKNGLVLFHNKTQGVVWRWTPIAGDASPTCRVEILLPLDAHMPVLGRSLIDDEIIRRCFSETRQIQCSIREPELVRLMRRNMQVFMIDCDVRSLPDTANFMGRLVIRAQEVGLVEGTWPLAYAMAATKYAAAADVAE